MTESLDKRFSKKEEFANALSHGLGTILAIAGLIFLINTAVTRGNIWHIISFSTFGATLVLLYLSSTLNHSLPKGKAKDFFHNFDQIAIFLLIAGTYTPIALVALKNDWGWHMFGLQWGFALAGIVAKLFLPNKFEKGVNIFFIISYIVMGWMVLFFLFPIYRHLPKTGILLIFLGGFSYTFGTLFFKLEKLPFSHLIWHLFVIGGSALHWVAIVKYII
ncbi:MAG: hemolysin III family protein [Salinivirgaceae bacterium]|nr:hemolysin III family protein [Salinivirgaceae bacterium]